MASPLNLRTTSRVFSALGPLCLGLLLTVQADAAPDTPSASPAHTPADPLSRFRDPEGMPEDLKGRAEVIDRPDAALPLDSVFYDSSGKKVRLRDYFAAGRPVLLQFVYYRCPSLCSVVLNGTVDTLRQLSWTPGVEYEVVSISINPLETSNLARSKKKVYMRELDRPGAEEGWHFLTGTEAQVAPLAGAAGFGYRFDTKSSEYAHGAALFVVTPEGRLSRTIYGAMYEPRTLRFSLLEASHGQIGSPLDRILLYCYHYDPESGRYTPEIMNIMRLAGLLSVLALAVVLGTYFWQERRQRRLAAVAESATASPGGSAS